MFNILKQNTEVWWRYLISTMYPNTVEMFKVLAAHCEEGCESCHLILCKKLKEKS